MDLKPIAKMKTLLMLVRNYLKLDIELFSRWYFTWNLKLANNVSIIVATNIKPGLRTDK